MIILSLLKTAKILEEEKNKKPKEPSNTRPRVGEYNTDIELFKILARQTFILGGASLHGGKNLYSQYQVGDGVMKPTEAHFVFGRLGSHCFQPSYEPLHTDLIGDLEAISWVVYPELAQQTGMQKEQVWKLLGERPYLNMYVPKLHSEQYRFGDIYDRFAFRNNMDGTCLLEGKFAENPEHDALLRSIAEFCGIGNLQGSGSDQRQNLDRVVDILFARIQETNAPTPDLALDMHQPLARFILYAFLHRIIKDEQVDEEECHTIDDFAQGTFKNLLPGHTTSLFQVARRRVTTTFDYLDAERRVQDAMVRGNYSSRSLRRPRTTLRRSTTYSEPISNKQRTRLGPRGAYRAFLAPDLAPPTSSSIRWQNSHPPRNASSNLQEPTPAPTGCDPDRTEAFLLKPLRYDTCKAVATFLAEVEFAKTSGKIRLIS